MKQKQLNWKVLIVILLIVLIAIVGYDVLRNYSSKHTGNSELFQNNSQSILNSTPSNNTQQVSVDPALQKVFEGYRKAIKENNLFYFKAYLSSEGTSLIEKNLKTSLTQVSFDQLCSQLNPILPPPGNIIVYFQLNQGYSARWLMQDKTHLNNRGTLDFVKEFSEWKILKETWTNSSS